MKFNPAVLTVLTVASGWFSNYGLSIFVNAMEPPDTTSSKLYRYTYRLGHGLISGNMNRIGMTKTEPPQEQK